jgi:hypothetical protein
MRPAPRQPVVAQRPLQHLAGGRLRQLVDELDDFRLRVRGEPDANPILDLLGRDRLGVGTRGTQLDELCGLRRGSGP